MTKLRLSRRSALALRPAYAAVAALFLIPGPFAAAQTSQAVTLRFAAEFAGKPFNCSNAIEGVGTGKSTVTPIDFRLYVSDIQLVRADGALVPLALEQDGKWQHRNLALLDFEDGAAGCGNGTRDTRTVVTGAAPSGAYKGVRFNVGVPFDLNHQDPTLAASPLNLTAMFWTWQGGYKFIKIDFGLKGAVPEASKTMSGGHAERPAAPKMDSTPMAKPAAPSPAFAIHLGSTLCKSDSRTTPPSACANPNRMEILFPEFDPATNVIVFDPAPVLASTDVTLNTPDTSPGCMSFPNDPECNTVMPKLGFDYGGQKAQPQSFVRMR
jgi:uncharacterized repeat protein (TIGR04052 family)